MGDGRQDRRPPQGSVTLKCPRECRSFRVLKVHLLPVALLGSFVPLLMQAAQKVLFCHNDLFRGDRSPGVGRWTEKWCRFEGLHTECKID